MFKANDYLKVKDQEAAHCLREIFITQAKTISLTHSSPLKLDPSKNNESLASSNLDIDDIPKARIDIIKKGKRAFDNVKKLKQQLHFIRMEKNDKENAIDEQSDKCDIEKADQKSRTDKRFKDLKLRTDKLIVQLTKTPHIDTKKLFSVRKSAQKMLSTQNLHMERLKALITSKNYKKTFMFGECLNTQKIEQVDMETPDPKTHKILVNGFNKSVKHRLAKSKTSKELNKHDSNFALQKNHESTKYTSYKQNNMNLQNIYEKMYKNQADKKVRLKNELVRLKIHEEWRRFVAKKDVNYASNFFTQFLSEKNFVGATY